MKKLIVLLASLGLIVAMVACAAPAPAPPPAPAPAPTPAPPPAPPPAPDKIVFGQAIGLSGPTAAAVGFLEVPIIDLWLEEVNKKGGIYVPQYDKRIPVELLRYDDKGDISTTLKLFEKLVTVDKVDILLPPHGTAWHLAVAPLSTKYKYPLVSFTCATEKLRELAHKYPYFFSTINNPRETMKSFVDLMVELGVKTAALIYVSHEFGIEYTTTSAPIMGPAGIDLLMLKTYPFGPTDLSPLLKEAKAANVDAFIAHSYVPGTFLLPEQAMVLDFNPKLFYVALACAWPGFVGKFGAEGVEGIMGPGGWNPGIPYPEAKEFYDKFLAMHGRPPCNWSSAHGYATLQVYEQAIAKVGFEDLEKLRDVIATETFMTAIGPVKYENQFNFLQPSMVGQWQNGVFESIAPKETSTAEPIYPKPPWPK